MDVGKKVAIITLSTLILTAIAQSQTQSVTRSQSASVVTKTGTPTQSATPITKSQTASQTSSGFPLQSVFDNTQHLYCAVDSNAVYPLAANTTRGVAMVSAMVLSCDKATACTLNLSSLTAVLP